MKIGFVSRNAFPLDSAGQRGGVGRYLATVVPELASRGAQVHVISENVTNAYQRERIAGGTVHYLPRWRPANRWVRKAELAFLKTAAGRHLWADISLKARRAAILSDWLHEALSGGTLRGLDIIEFPDIGAEGFLFLRSAPLVATVSRVHGPTQFLIEERGASRSAGRSLLCRAERDAVSRSTLVTAPSRYAAVLAKSSWKLTSGLPIPVPNPLDVAVFCPPSVKPAGQGRVVLLYSGRLQAGKGLSRLPAIVRALAGAGVDFEIRFAGRDTALAPNGSSYQRYLKEQVGSELCGHLVFLGHLDLDALIAQLRSADLCLFLSTETFGYACCEAMACGAAVLVSGSGAFPEFVFHQKNGFVVTDGSEAALTRTVTAACRDRQRLHAFGRAARETMVGRFDVKAVCSDLLSVYESAARRARKRS